MRCRVEIQRAHDLLTGILLDPRLRAAISPSDMQWAIARADVLCWVLLHDHNERFAQELAAIETLLQDTGFQLVDSGKLQRTPT